MCVCEATRILLVLHDRSDESDGHDLAKFYVYIKRLLLYPEIEGSRARISLPMSICIRGAVTAWTSSVKKEKDCRVGFISNVCV